MDVNASNFSIIFDPASLLQLQQLGAAVPLL
jgi:hypothetical protein